MVCLGERDESIEIRAVRVPILACIGEGGSGAGVEVGVGRPVGVFRGACLLSVITPEGCAAICGSPATQAPHAAKVDGVGGRRSRTSTSVDF